MRSTHGFQVRREIHVHRRPGQIDEMNIGTGLCGEQWPEPGISIQPKSEPEQVAWQDERNGGASFQATSHDVAAAKAPPVQEALQVASAQQGKIQRQDQQGGLEPAGMHAAAH